MFATEFLDIPPLDSAAGTVALPGSKSISNRVLLLAALSGGTTTVHDLLDSDDTRVMLDALRALGCGVEHGTARSRSPAWPAARRPRTPKLFLGNAGTAMRPLTAALAVIGGEFELSGVARMHERPIGDLVDALRQSAADIDTWASRAIRRCASGRPQLQARRAHPGARRRVEPVPHRAADGAAAVAARTRTIVIEVVGELISKPYIEITLNLLARFGVDGARATAGSASPFPPGSRYRRPGSIHVEADASSASYFVALGAIAAQPAAGAHRRRGRRLDPGRHPLRRRGAADGRHRSTGGANWLEVSRGAWPLKAIDLDCNHIPDAAMTLAVMALYADGPSTLRNIASWRVKETDRLAAMATELRKLGADGGGRRRTSSAITPPAATGSRPTIHTYDDHRIAMCFSLAAFNPRAACRCASRTRSASPRPSRIISRPCSRVAQTPTAPHIPVICVDGPTASGQGHAGLARSRTQLGYHYLDSGALYRITALAARARPGLSWTRRTSTASPRWPRHLPVRFSGGHVCWARGRDATRSAPRRPA